MRPRAVRSVKLLQSGMAVALAALAAVYGGYLTVLLLAAAAQNALRLDDPRGALVCTALAGVTPAVAAMSWRVDRGDPSRLAKVSVIALIASVLVTLAVVAMTLPF